MESALRTDYHMHLERDDVTENCRFNAARVLTYGLAAANAGVAEIGISEHCHRFDAFRPLMKDLLEPQPVIGGWWLPQQFNYSLDDYVAEVMAAARGQDGTLERTATPGAARSADANGEARTGPGHGSPPVPVRLGLEVDYLPGHEADTRDLLANHPWDYIIGSVHFLPGWAIDVDPALGWPDRHVDQAYRDYFELLGEAAGSGLFDILAHPDLIKKFGHRPSFDLTPLYRRAATACALGGIVAEVSTAGWHVPAGEAYPAPAFLAALAAAGVPISLASDAHDPAHLGRDLDRAVALARSCGYRHHTGFVRRRRRQLPLR